MFSFFTYLLERDWRIVGRLKLSLLGFEPGSLDHLSQSASVKTINKFI